MSVNALLISRVFNDGIFLRNWIKLFLKLRMRFLTIFPLGRVSPQFLSRFLINTASIFANLRGAYWLKGFFELLNQFISTVSNLPNESRKNTFEEKKKLDNQTHNDLDIPLDSKNCRKRVYKKNFVLKSLKLLLLRFKFWKILGVGQVLPQTHSSSCFGTK